MNILRFFLNILQYNQFSLWFRYYWTWTGPHLNQTTDSVQGSAKLPELDHWFSSWFKRWAFWLNQSELVQTGSNCVTYLIYFFRNMIFLALFYLFLLLLYSNKFSQFHIRTCYILEYYFYLLKWLKSQRDKYEQ